jgi:pantothenate kinase
VFANVFNSVDDWKYLYQIKHNLINIKFKRSYPGYEGTTNNVLKQDILRFTRFTNTIKFTEVDDIIMIMGMFYDTRFD